MKKLISLLLLIALCLMRAFSIAEMGKLNTDGSKFVGVWYSDRAEMNVIRDLESDDGGAVFTVYVYWSGSANEMNLWLYPESRFDGEKGFLVCDGKGTLLNVTLHDDGREETLETLYEDGSASFSFDADGNLVWADYKADPITSFAFERVGEPADISDAVIDLGESEIYTMEDRAAAQRVLYEFENFSGCALRSLRYISDSCVTSENLEWMNELSNGRDMGATFTQVIGFVSDFHSPANESFDAFEVDTEYADWQWWLAREEGGAWKLLTWGY